MYAIVLRRTRLGNCCFQVDWRVLPAAWVSGFVLVWLAIRLTHGHATVDSVITLLHAMPCHAMQAALLLEGGHHGKALAPIQAACVACPEHLRPLADTLKSMHAAPCQPFISASVCGLLISPHCTSEPKRGCTGNCMTSVPGVGPCCPQTSIVEAGSVEQQALALVQQAFSAVRADDLGEMLGLASEDACRGMST
jgi:hypothetical protein